MKRRTSDDETAAWPNYRRGRLEEYARLGFRRTVRAIDDAIHRGYAASRMLAREGETCQMTLDILNALVEAGCLAPITAGIREENESDEKERSERAERRKKEP